MPERRCVTASEGKTLLSTILPHLQEWHLRGGNQQSNIQRLEIGPNGYSNHGEKVRYIYD